MVEQSPDANSQQIQKLAGAIRWLGVIVFFNCLLLVALIVVLFSTWIPIMVTQAYEGFNAEGEFTDRAASIRLPAATSEEEYRDYHAWPLEKRIKAASVIFTTKNVERDGKIVGVVDEILKRQPDVRFYYQVGDIYDHNVTRGRHGSTTYRAPHGMIVFCAGNPARMRFATSYSEDQRSMSMGGMRIEDIKDLIEKQK